MTAPSDLQNGINAINWAQTTGLVTTSQVQALFNQIVQIYLNGALLTSATSVGIGYTTGTGGAVTQLTSKATGVTLNTLTGSITMNNAALTAGTIVSFTLTDSAIGANDVLVLNHDSGGTIGSYGLNASTVAGSAVIYVRNNTAGSLSEAIVIAFAVIKGAVS